MIIYAVDDEPILLQKLNDAIIEAKPDADLHSYLRATPLLTDLKSGSPLPDVVFLDIELPGMGGIELAKQIKLLSPKTWIIFVTGFSQYAVEAYQIHAEGYIMKPVTSEKIKIELSTPRRVLFPSQSSERIKVHTFGNFDVFVDEQPLNFPRKKSKEMFAYLVHKAGTACTAREMAAILFEDSPFDKKQLDYLSKIASDMRKTFENVNAIDVLLLGYDSYAIDPDKIDCDYYRFIIHGDWSALNSYTGDYMAQYSWAEITASYLDQKHLKP